MNHGGYHGSPSVMTSTVNEELVPDGFVFRHFTFINLNICTVKINGSNPIFLDAEQGFSSDSSGTPVKSFIVVETGINYNWIGEYEYVTIRQ